MVPPQQETTLKLSAWSNRSDGLIRLTEMSFAGLLIFPFQQRRHLLVSWKEACALNRNKFKQTNRLLWYFQLTFPWVSMFLFCSFDSLYLGGIIHLCVATIYAKSSELCTESTWLILNNSHPFIPLTSILNHQLHSHCAFIGTRSRLLIQVTNDHLAYLLAICSLLSTIEKLYTPDSLMLQMWCNTNQLFSLSWRILNWQEKPCLRPPNPSQALPDAAK